MSNPSCLQIGSTCRYADTSGTVHDAVIIDIVSALTRVVSLSYDDGQATAQNVPYSRNPARNHWGCADEGSPHVWGAIATVSNSGAPKENG
jgi:hypothetical protein